MTNVHLLVIVFVYLGSEHVSVSSNIPERVQPEWKYGIVPYIVDERNMLTVMSHRLVNSVSMVCTENCSKNKNKP